MITKVHKRDKYRISIKVDISTNNWLKYLNKAQESLRSNLKVTGFERGYVPKKVFKNKVSKEDIYLKAIEITLKKIIVESSIKFNFELYDQPEVKVLHVDDLSSSFLITGYLLPSVEIEGYKNIDPDKLDKNIPLKDSLQKYLIENSVLTMSDYVKDKEKFKIKSLLGSEASEYTDNELTAATKYNIHLDNLVKAIAFKENIKVREDEIEDYYKELAKINRASVDQVKQYISKPLVISDLLKVNVIDYLIETNKLI